MTQDTTTTPDDGTVSNAVFAEAMNSTQRDTIEVPVGCVACILSDDDEIGFTVVHNIKVAHDGELPIISSPGVAQLMIALALANIIDEDEPAMQAAMIRVSRKLQNGTLKLV